MRNKNKKINLLKKIFIIIHVVKNGGVLYRRGLVISSIFVTIYGLTDNPR